jgi:hypothetical protein
MKTANTKDEIILMYKKKWEQSEKDNAEMKKQLEATQKGNAGSEE